MTKRISGEKTIYKETKIFRDVKDSASISAVVHTRNVRDIKVTVKDPLHPNSRDVYVGSDLVQIFLGRNMHISVNLRTGEFKAIDRTSLEEQTFTPTIAMERAK